MSKVLLIADMQEGLFSLARDFDHSTYRTAMFAHASPGQAFRLPVIMTTSFVATYPDAPLIRREGEVGAWDNEEFPDAVVKANRSQVILARITYDGCTTFLALSLRAAGYSVWANHEASGTTTQYLRDMANERMRAAGVQVVSYFAIELFPVLDEYLPIYGMVARGHRAAVRNGTVLPGEDVLP
ncbi:Isochorismatase hydrolase [Hypoxylon fragiforme]|uniref:Isochorismatase hydrolase n=1 Tax=Hypoxylon fragiforme TaxID=63214 RepID=UPI0020C6FA9A|nr:Isochorismatase hydrolase [Hypoxylon fragiforme]KAI2612680.1 Isochorismatase hydrolase [Hypoxylon fragiforme]